jgi:hypothetical protein
MWRSRIVPAAARLAARPRSFGARSVSLASGFVVPDDDPGLEDPFDERLAMLEAAEPEKYGPFRTDRAWARMPRYYSHMMHAWRKDSKVLWGRLEKLATPEELVVAAASFALVKARSPLLGEYFAKRLGGDVKDLSGEYLAHAVWAMRVLGVPKGAAVWAEAEAAASKASLTDAQKAGVKECFDSLGRA